MRAGLGMGVYVNIQLSVGERRYLRFEWEGEESVVFCGYLDSLVGSGTRR